MARIDLRENEYMEAFVGQNHVDSNDVQFWYQLLSCSFNFMRVQDPKTVEKTLDPYIVRLALNNNESLNIGSLVRVFLDRVSRIKSPSGQSANPAYVFQSFNALYLLRSICKSYIESLSEEQLVKAFRSKVDPPQVSHVAPQQQTQPPQPPVQMQNPSTQDQSNDATILTTVQTSASYPIPPNQLQTTDETLTTNSDTTSPTENSQQNQLTITTETNSNNVDVNRSTTKAVTDQESKKKPDVSSGTTMLDQFIATLIAVIVDIPLSDSTYLLQVESINALLVLLSVQMYSATPANQSVIYKCLMQKKCSIHALILTKTLLTNFVNQQQVPQETGSIIIGLASGLWKVLTLGYGGGQEDEETENMPLLAKQSLLLLNILTNHYTSDKNPYREAMVSCQDSRYNLSDPQLAIDNANNDALATATTSKSVMMSNSIKIDFHKLYEAICKYLYNDQVALLLYLLLHSNKIFRPYILTTVSTELDQLVLPLLKILYASIEKGSHHVYMVLILFIILSEEETFSIAVHKITIRGVPWYKDRVFSEISLGSLTALVIIRSFQYNTLRIKDKFLHTNLFATLANLSNHFDHLHPYVCQRIVDLLERLTKRYLLATKTTSLDKSPHQRTLEVLDNPLAKALATDTHKQDIQDASSLELDSTSRVDITSTLSSQSNANHGINISIPNQLHQMPDHVATGTAIAQAQENSPSVRDDSDGQKSPKPESINISIDDVKQDIGLVEEVIRMLLEVINNSLATKLRNNPDLVYTLLYKRSIFNSLLSSNQSFYNMVINIERILTFFYSKIENFERQLTVEEIKDVIQSTAKQWNFDVSRDPNSRLLFHYVEDEQPEDFFIPYIWTRIYYSSGINWNSKRIVLFNPEDL